MGDFTLEWIPPGDKSPWLKSTLISKQGQSGARTPGGYSIVVQLMASENPLVSL